MPPKEEVGAGGFIFAEATAYQHVDLRDHTSMFPAIGEEMYSHIAMVQKCTKIEAVRMLEIIKSGYSSLYLKYPKKARRKLKKSVRIHKKNWRRAA